MTDNAEPSAPRERVDRLAGRLSSRQRVSADEESLSPTTAAELVTPTPEVAASLAPPQPRTPAPARVRSTGKDTRWDELNSRFQVWLSHDIQARLKAAATSTQTSISRAVTEALEDWIVKKNHKV
jgi:hypothetical protein